MNHVNFFEAFGLSKVPVRLVQECINVWDIGDKYLSVSAFYSQYLLTDKRQYDHGVGFTFIFEGDEVRADYDYCQLSIMISEVPQSSISSKLGSLVLGLVIFNALGKEFLPNECNSLPMYTFNSVVNLISEYSTIDKMPVSGYKLEFDCCSRMSNLTMARCYDIPTEEAVLIPFFVHYREMIEKYFPVVNKIVSLNIYNIHSLDDIPDILVDLEKIIRDSTTIVEYYKNIAIVEPYTDYSASKNMVQIKRDYDAPPCVKEERKRAAVKRMLEALIDTIMTVPDAAMKVGESDNTYEGDNFHMHYKLNYHRASFRWTSGSYKMCIDFTVSILDDHPKATITDFQIPTVEGKINSKLYHFIKHGLCKYAYIMPMLDKDDGIFSGWE